MGPEELAAWCQRLADEPGDADAAHALKSTVLRTEREATRQVLHEVVTVLEGPGWTDLAEAAPALRRQADATLQETRILHPLEKEQQQQLTSMAVRSLQLMTGSDSAAAVRSVTEPLSALGYPRTSRLLAECAGLLELRQPAAHVLRGSERAFGVRIDQSPFLVIHRDYLDEGPKLTTAAPLEPLTRSELRFALGRNLQHIRSGHAAYLQLRPERLAQMLERVPNVARIPVQLNQTLKKLADWLPASSLQTASSVVSSLLPESEPQILPEGLVEQVRNWLLALEYSADRAGLLVCGSVAAACAGIVRTTAPTAECAPDLIRQGGRALLRRNDLDRGVVLRLRELLRFILSDQYLAFVNGA